MKLNKDEGYKLLNNIVTSWFVKEHSLADAEEYVDDFMSEYGRDLYEEALKWTGGTGYNQKKEWLGLPEVEGMVEDYGELHRLDFPDHIGEIATFLLDVTVNVVRPFVDVEVQRPVVKMKVREKMISERYFTCGCGSDNVVQDVDRVRDGVSSGFNNKGHRCRTCGKTYDLVVS